MSSSQTTNVRRWNSCLRIQIQDGARSNSARDYIIPALSRSNLDVLVNTQVTKVLKTGTDGETPIVTGVQFASGPKAAVYNITANKEVILSAGAIGTPQIRESPVLPTCSFTQDSLQYSY